MNLADRYPRRTVRAALCAAALSCMLWPASAPHVYAADWSGAAGSATGSIQFTFTMSSAITLAVNGSNKTNQAANIATTVAQPGGSGTAANIALGTVYANCFAEPSGAGGGDCVEISAGTNPTGANIVNNVIATVTYAGCSANSGTIGLTATLGTMPASSITPRYCESSAQAGGEVKCNSSTWANDDFATALPTVAGTNMETGMASGGTYDFELGTKIRDSDSGGPFSWTLTITAGCT